VCVAAVCDNPEAASSRWRSAYISSSESSALLESYRAAARYVDPEAIAIEKSGQIMFILGAASYNTGKSKKDSLQSAVEMGQQILRGLRFFAAGKSGRGGESRQHERQFLLGIGRPCENALELHRSYKEARRALAIGSQLQGTGPII